MEAELGGKVGDGGSGEDTEGLEREEVVGLAALVVEDLRSEIAIGGEIAGGGGEVGVAALEGRHLSSEVPLDYHFRSWGGSKIRS